jgi:hypothetical protein
VANFENDDGLDFTISDDDMLGELFELWASLALLFDLLLVVVVMFEVRILSNEPRVSWGESSSALTCFWRLIFDLVDELELIWCIDADVIEERVVIFSTTIPTPRG